MYKNKTVDTSAFDAASGSLKLNLHKDYLKSLGEGTHTITVNFKDGSVAVDIVVPKLAEEKKEEPAKQEEKKEEKKEEPAQKDEKEDTPKTADTSTVTVWFILLLVAMVAASVAMYSNRKRESEI